MIVRSRLPEIHIPDKISCAQFILQRCEDVPSKPALIDAKTERIVTYKELWYLTSRLAHGLRSQGVSKGDVLCVISYNSVDSVVLFLAITSLGAVVTDVNPIYTSDEIIRQLQDSGSTWLFIDQSQTSKISTVLHKCPNIKEVVVLGSEDKTGTYKSLSNLYAPPETKDTLPAVDIDGRNDTALLPYSSGTTGTPKGVILTHYNFIANTMQITSGESTIHEEKSDVIIAIQPFFHASGKIVTLGSGLVRAATLVVSGAFDYHTFLHLIEKYKATKIVAPPPVLVRMSKDPELIKFDLRSVKCLNVGSAPVPRQAILQLVTRLNLTPNDVREGYGMTEGTCVSHNNYKAATKLGSVGTLIPNTEAKIISVENGLELGSLERGELCVRGPQVMKGYHKSPEKTRETIDTEGWLHTGDIAYYDEDGFFYIVDRLKELIKVKGFQVAPAELEEVLLTHPDVADVGVTGISDERSGQLPKAFIVLKPGHKTTTQSIQQYVAEKLAPYKQLKGGVVFIPEIPKSASGKILRKELLQYHERMTSKL